MKMDAFAFGTTNWAEVERTEYKGETGAAYWRTRFLARVLIKSVYGWWNTPRATSRTIGARKDMFSFAWKASLKRPSKTDGSSF